MYACFIHNEFIFFMHVLFEVVRTRYAHCTSVVCYCIYVLYACCKFLYAYCIHVVCILLVGILYKLDAYHCIRVVECILYLSLHVCYMFAMYILSIIIIISIYWSIAIRSILHIKRCGSSSIRYI